MARKVRAKNCERHSDGWNPDQKRGGEERGGGHLNLLSPLVPGPVTVTWGEGGLENWSVTCRERDRMGPDGI